MSHSHFIIGLDIGGANIKLCTSRADAVSFPFELWRKPDELGPRLREIAGRYQLPDTLAVTMTGELCDCFRTKAQGVERILQSVTQGWPELAVEQVRVWSTAGRYVSILQAVESPLSVAAANWHGQGTALARRFPGRSLLIDTGSTTTDILWLESGQCRAQGLTDMDRLSTGELVYLGAGRTALMALGPTVPWLNREFGVMNEMFADVRDLWLVMGLKPDQPEDNDTWDRRPATRVHASERLLRMVGADTDQADPFEASALANAFAQIHADRIGAAVGRVLAGRRPDRVILSGSGDFAAGFGAARVASLASVPRVRLAEIIGAEGSGAACAWAMVELARVNP